MIVKYFVLQTFTDHKIFSKTRLLFIAPHKGLSFVLKASSLFLYYISIISLGLYIHYEYYIGHLMDFQYKKYEADEFLWWDALSRIFWFVINYEAFISNILSTSMFEPMCNPSLILLFITKTTYQYLNYRNTYPIILNCRLAGTKT